MPSITTKSFNDLVSGFATTVQGLAATLTDFAVGSVLRALAEAHAGVTSWLESLILILLQTTRLATSSGSDVDSFINDFGLTRSPAVQATGTVTFSRFTATNQATIPVGATLSSNDLSQQYTVIADTTQSAYNPTLNAYIIPAGNASASATVQAVTAGTAANVAANTITVITQPIQYVDTVTNAAPIVNGANAQTDAQVRSAFIAYLASLAKATVSAIIQCVQALQVGASCVVVEFQNYAGTTQMGYFYAIVDDGSGSPGSTFLSNASNAINVTRACGIQFNVYAPITVTANVVMTITAAAGYTLSAVEAAVQSALQVYLQSLTLGQTCMWSKLAQVAYNTPGVQEVTAWTLNGGTSDIAPTAQQRVIAGTVMVN